MRGRGLRSALVASFLAPLLSIGLVVGGPVGEASAAIRHGSGHGWKLDIDTPLPTFWASCAATSFYRMDGDTKRAQQSVQTRAGNCDTGAGIDLEGGRIDLVFAGETSTGAACSLWSTAGIEGGEETFDGNTSNTIYVTPETACQVQTVCMTVTEGDPMFGDPYKGTKCRTLNMGEPQFPGDRPASRCAVADALGAGVAEVNHTAWWNGEMRHFWQGRARWSGNVPMWVSVVLRHNTSGELRYEPNATAELQPGQGEIDFGGYSLGDPVFADWHVVGVQMWVNRNKTGPVNPDWYSPEENGPTSGGGAYWIAQAPPAAGRFLGTTDSSHCRWYFGEKIATGGDLPENNDPAGPMSDVDVPDGVEEPAPVTPPTAAPEESCTFSLGDPSTWLSGGMCAAVGLLGAIWQTLGEMLSALWGLVDALGRLAAEIFGPIVDALAGLAGAIVDGIKALLIPSDGIFDGWKSLRAQAEARAPFSIVLDLGAAGKSVVSAFSSNGDCGVLATFDTPGQAATVDCASLKSTPGYGALYALMSAVLGVSTLFVCANLVRSSIT